MPAAVRAFAKVALPPVRIVVSVIDEVPEVPGVFWFRMF
jgi:hypothetical protein